MGGGCWGVGGGGDVNGWWCVGVWVCVWGVCEWGVVCVWMSVCVLNFVNTPSIYVLDIVVASTFPWLLV